MCITVQGAVLATSNCYRVQVPPVKAVQAGKRGHVVQTPRVHRLLPKRQVVPPRHSRRTLPSSTWGGPTSVCSEHRQWLLELWQRIETEFANRHVHSQNGGKMAAIAGAKSQWRGGSSPGTVMGPKI